MENLNPEVKTKKPNAFSAVFKSNLARNILLLFAVLVAAACLFLVDAYNDLKLNSALSVFTKNILIDFWKLLGIKQVNVMESTWIIFEVIFALIVIFIIASMIEKPFIRHKMKQACFKNEEKAIKTYKALYYFTVSMICLLGIGLFIVLGGAKKFDAGISGIFLNSVYTYLFLILYMAFIIFALFLIYYLIKFIVAIIIGIALFIKFLILDITGWIAGKKHGLGGTGDDDKVNVALLDKDPNLERDIFPALTQIDLDNAEEKAPTPAEFISLDDMAMQFQSYACNHHKIYYELPVIRAFLAGLAASRLIVLEGLSGTGKSMLPRMFAAFTGSDTFFTPVQATWRDKSDLLGYYSEFTKSFKSTEFLASLYGATYSDKVNIKVLDEMNISRIEYYFADFLSILEFPEEDWRIRVYEPEIGQKLPQKLEGGYIKIPNNTWFIGTANTDDSTFTITDKVCDRAILLNFKDRIRPIETDFPSDPISLDAETLNNMFNEAKEDEANRLNREDLDRFYQICDFTKDALDIRFGNRVMVQIENFVPVYVALGGTKEEALDFMFASKVLRKLTGLLEDYVKDELVALLKLIHSLYGKGVFKETEAIIQKIIKRLG